MRKVAVLTLVLPTMLLGGCSSLGLFDRERPDEFAVTRSAPLVVPPDFAMVPPAPGASPSNAGDASVQAVEAMFGGAAARTAVEQGLLNNASKKNPDASIRSQVDDPNTQIADKGVIIADIVASPEGDGRDSRVAVPQ